MRDHGIPCGHTFSIQPGLHIDLLKNTCDVPWCKELYPECRRVPFNGVDIDVIGRCSNAKGADSFLIDRLNAAAEATTVVKRKRDGLSVGDVTDSEDWRK